MLPEQMNHRALDGGSRQAVADALGVSITTVNAHCLTPPDRDGTNGRKSPAEGVILTYATLCQRGEFRRAAEYIRYVALECGHAATPLPAADPAKLDVVASAVKHFGEMLTATAQALTDGRLTAAEAEAILPEAEDVLGVLMPFVRALQGVVVEDETARERVRRGPRRALSNLSQLRNDVLRVSVA